MTPQLRIYVTHVCAGKLVRLVLRNMSWYFLVPMSRRLKMYRLMNSKMQLALVVSEYKNQVYTYTRELLKDLQAQGYFTMAISGSHHEMVAEVARELGLTILWVLYIVAKRWSVYWRYGFVSGGR